MFDWQTILVILIVAAAAAYVGAQALNRLRSFNSKRAASSCETGCGNCPGSKVTVKAEIQPLVQLSGAIKPKRK